jgi:glycerol-3-phosphate dehydrogenase (NAD(P)+)
VAVSKIQVIGSGSWGTSLSIALSQKFDVVISSIDNEIVSSINSKNVSPIFPEIKLPANISSVIGIQPDFKYCILVIPSHFIPKFVIENLDTLKSQENLIIASKGMNHEKPELFSDFFESHSIEASFLSGPNFADEIARNLPAYANLAGKNYNKVLGLSNALSSNNFMLSPTDDYKSVQISGCYKNILAIYCGYIIGKGYGENYRAAICTKAIGELKNICVSLGTSSEAIYSYAGIGDIMLTCFSNKSRNFRMGDKLANSLPVNSEECIEGIMSTKSLYKLLGDDVNKFEIISEVHKLIKKM